MKDELVFYIIKNKHCRDSIKAYSAYAMGLFFEVHPEYKELKPQNKLIDINSYDFIEYEFKNYISELKEDINYIIIIPSLDSVANSSRAAFQLLRKLKLENINIYVLSLSVRYDIKNMPKNIISFYQTDSLSTRGRKRFYTQQQIDAAIKDKDEGKTYKQIKEDYGMCKNTLRKYRDN